MDSWTAVGFLNVLINSRLLSLTRVRIKIFHQVNFFSKTLMMDFIQFEAIDESQQNKTINFLDDEKTNEDKNFLDDSEQLMEDVSFYRKSDRENIDHYNTFTNQTRDPKIGVKFDPENIDHCDTSEFTNQTRDPRVVVYEDDKMFFGTEDTQPELYNPKDRENVEFDKFDGFEKFVKKFKETLQNFKNSDNPFFDLITFG